VQSLTTTEVLTAAFLQKGSASIASAGSIIARFFIFVGFGMLLYRITQKEAGCFLGAIIFFERCAGVSAKLAKYCEIGIEKKGRPFQGSLVMGYVVFYVINDGGDERCAHRPV
jgi:hypothetical protein